VLGIVIGVGAVIAMVTIGNGTTAKVAAELARLGSNLLSVRPGQFGPGRASAETRPFNLRDIEALRAQLRGVRTVAPTSQKATTIVYGSENRSEPVTGTENGYFLTHNWSWPRAGGHSPHWSASSSATSQHAARRGWTLRHE
jgi:putative ABC transport system permease protein